MASVIVSLRIMPEAPGSDLERIAGEAKGLIEEFGGKVGKTEFSDVAFGLKSINIMFIMPEAKGGTEELETKISGINEVSSVEVTDVRRAIG